MTEADTRYLPCTLTAEETSQRQERLLAQLSERDEVVTRQKQTAGMTRQEIKAIDKNIATLRECLQSGREIRPVKVRDRKVMSTRRMETIRVDTEEVIDSRPLTPDELQDDLPFTRAQGEHSVSYLHSAARSSETSAGDTGPTGSSDDDEPPRNRGRRRSPAHA